jgi:hypothetical protein
MGLEHGVVVVARGRGSACPRLCRDTPAVVGRRGRAGLLLGAERSASTLGSAATDARGRSLTRCCRSPASRLGSRTHGGRGAVVVELDEKGALAAASLLDVATVASTRSDGVVAAAGARARPKLGAARRLWLRGEVVLGVAGWWSRAAASWGRRGERRLGLLYASWPRVPGVLGAAGGDPRRPCRWAGRVALIWQQHGRPGHECGAAGARRRRLGARGRT